MSNSYFDYDEDSASDLANSLHELKNLLDNVILINEEEDYEILDFDTVDNGSSMLDDS